MRNFRSIRPVVWLLLMLALLVAPLHGARAGWLCHCTGEMVMAPDCHTAECHGQHDDEPVSPCDDGESHEAVHEEWLGARGEANVTLPPALLAWVMELPVTLLMPRLPGTWAQSVPSRPPPSPPPVIVPRQSATVWRL